MAGACVRLSCAGWRQTATNYDRASDEWVAVLPIRGASGRLFGARRQQAQLTDLTASALGGRVVDGLVWSDFAWANKFSTQPDGSLHWALTVAEQEIAAQGVRVGSLLG